VVSWPCTVKAVIKLLLHLKHNKWRWHNCLSTNRTWRLQLHQSSTL